MSDFWKTLPDRLEASGTDLDREAADRIVELETQVVRLRAAIASHRGHRDFTGGKIEADRNLWVFIDDMPWGKPIKGDG